MSAGRHDVDHNARYASEETVRQDLQRQPLVLMKLAENSLTVAESLRDNYFKNTAAFVAALRTAMHRDPPIVDVMHVDNIGWQELQGEVATFVDGGVGHGADLQSGAHPTARWIILRTHGGTSHGGTGAIWLLSRDPRRPRGR